MTYAPVLHAAAGSLLIVALLGGAVAVALRIWKARPALLGWGALCFIASQLVHIPVLVGLTAALKPLGAALSADQKLALNVVILGGTAGLFEELARWLFLRRLRAPRWQDALAFGLGHGGIEALLIGLLAPVQALVMLAFGDSILAKVGNDPATAAKVREQVEGVRHLTLLMGLVPAWERAMAVVLHLALTGVVWLGVRRQKPSLLGLAILWHAVVDGLAVFAMSRGYGAINVELGMTAATVLSIAAIALVRRAAPATATPGAT